VALDEVAVRAEHVTGQPSRRTPPRVAGRGAHVIPAFDDASTTTPSTPARAAPSTRAASASRSVVSAGVNGVTG